MGVDIKVGPPVLTINRGGTFLVTDLGGEIDPAAAQGAFAEDTRFISSYRLSVNGMPWECVTSAGITYFAARLELTNPELPDINDRSPIGARTVALSLERQIETNGLREYFHLANYSQAPAEFTLEVGIGSDFSDVFQVRAGTLVQRDHLDTRWNSRSSELRINYERGDFLRRLVYRVEESLSQPVYKDGRLVFDIFLRAGESWDIRCQALFLHTTQQRRVQRQRERYWRRSHSHQEWLHSCTGIRTPNADVQAAYLQSLEDLGALRLPQHDRGPNTWVPAAGVPWYVALFGRDSLIASYQTMMAHAPLALGALQELALYQARERDDWRDAQPGKILHEIRYGELTHFGNLPFTPYYGTADATILYLIVLHEAYRWTGNRRLVEKLLPVAGNCLDWIDNFGDLDGDGFQEWKTFSDHGFENMCWKDSEDGIVYGDGLQVPSPKGVCELDAYVFDAKVRMSEIFDDFGDRARAKRLRSEAKGLSQRFNDRLWMEDEDCYALGLDSGKRQINAVASNAGHCLWSGIVPADRARRLAHRLFQPDMWCGWGIRTLSSRNPAYNPYSYQRGSVWPHDNAIIAAGLKRYGFVDEANRVAEAIFAAASYFNSYRLPEVFSGLGRGSGTFPVQYIGANIPQAWAAGSVIHLLQTILGLRADAPNGVLYVNPTLPDWLPEITLDWLKIGNSALDLRFWRDGDESRFDVRHLKGKKISVELDPPGVEHA
jgi:glycogen debranching enzyme